MNEQSKADHSRRSLRRLFIIGASSFAREVESWLGLVPPPDRDWYLAGFLNSPQETPALSGYPSDLRVVGDWKNFEFHRTDYVILGVSDPFWKQEIWNALSGSVTFMTYVAPNVVLGEHNRVGEGSIICPGTVITTNVSIGRAVTINNSANIGHDAVIGDFSSIMGKAVVTGKVHLGQFVYLGAAAVVLPGTRVGDRAKVGAGSVVIRNVQTGLTVFGNPAKPLNHNLK